MEAITKINTPELRHAQGLCSEYNNLFKREIYRDKTMNAITICVKYAGGYQLVEDTDKQKAPFFETDDLGEMENFIINMIELAGGVH